MRARRRYIHRLVLEVFVGPCPEGMVACHNDGNPRNNALSNLRWDTREANMRDRDRHGTSPRGERGGNAKFTAAQAAVIIARAGAGETKSALAREYGVTDMTIGKMVRGVTYRRPETA